MAKVATDEHHRNAALDHLREPVVAQFVGTRCHDDTVYPVISQSIKGRYIFFGAVLADTDKDVVALDRHHLSHGARKLRGERVRDISKDKTNGVRALSLQSARQAIAAVVQNIDGLHDTFARLCADIAVLVDHA